MKLFLLLCFNIAVACLTVNAQQTPVTDSNYYKTQYTDFIKKQKANRTTGWVFAGAGAALFGIAISYPVPPCGYGIPLSKCKNPKGGGFRIGGGLLGLASLPFSCVLLNTGARQY